MAALSPLRCRLFFRLSPSPSSREKTSAYYFITPLPGSCSAGTTGAHKIPRPACTPCPARAARRCAGSCRERDEHLGRVVVVDQVVHAADEQQQQRQVLHPQHLWLRPGSARGSCAPRACSSSSTARENAHKARGSARPRAGRGSGPSLRLPKCRELAESRPANRAQLRPRSGTRARAVASSRAAPLTAPSTPRSWSGATRWSRSGAPSLEMLGTFAAVGAAWLHLALFCATLGALSHARGSPFAANIRARRAPRCPTLAFGILGAAGAGGGAAASFSPPRRRLFPVRRHSVRSPQKRAPMLAGLQTVRA